MRILVTGGSGLLGAHVAAQLATSHEVTAVDRNSWWGNESIQFSKGDLSDSSFMEQTFSQVRPEVVIHCAAMTHVDECEKDPALAYRTNSELTRQLVHCAPAGCKFVYISTDAVFPGEEAFVKEERRRCPQNTYGRSKVHGEWEVELSGLDHLIIRTNFYGWSSGRKKTFAEWLYLALAQREEITLFTDFFFNPIYVMDLVEAIDLLLAQGRRGIYHVAGHQRISKSQFGFLLADMAGFKTDHVRTDSMRDQLVAKRARENSLSIEKFMKDTGHSLPDCRAGLERFLRDKDRSLHERVLSQVTR